MYINGNSDRIMQVVINILSNAIMFSNTEGGEIWVHLYQQQGSAFLKISDNGIGIDTDKQALIFERFTQIHNAQLGKPKGSGLGLFITKQIVGHHNGKISVESKPNEGATFVIELPVLGKLL